MRILVLTPTFLPMVGGAEVLLLEVYRRLAERHDICLVTANKDLPPSDLDHLINFPVVRYRDRLSTMNFRGHRLVGGIVPPFSLSAVPATLKIATRFQPDVLNTHYVAHTGLAAVITHKRRSIPSVLSFTGRDVPGPRTPWFWKYYDRWVARSVTDVTYISHYSHQAIFGPHEKSGNIIPAGVDLKRFNPRHSRSGIRQRLNLSPDTPALLSVQRLSPEKRADIPIRAMPYVLRKHPQTRLVIGGKGPDQPNLISLAEKLGLEQHVDFIGYIPDADLPDYYAMADIFVFHSTYETFGIVLAEAMASGKPVVSVNSTAIPDVVQDGHTGLLAAPLDPVDLAHKIIYLLDSPEKQKEMGHTGRLWAEEHFDWDEIANQYEEVLAEATIL